MISAVGTVSVHTWIFLSSGSLSCEGQQQSLQLIWLPPEPPLVCLTAGPDAHLDLWWEVQTSQKGATIVQVGGWKIMRCWYGLHSVLYELQLKLVGSIFVLVFSTLNHLPSWVHACRLQTLNSPDTKTIIALCMYNRNCSINSNSNLKSTLILPI